MKKYFFEAQKKQLEKPTESHYVSCAPAKCWVMAASQEEAYAKAEKEFEAMFYGTGVKVGKPVLTKAADPAIDWNYGYGDQRKAGDDAARSELIRNHVIR